MCRRTFPEAVVTIITYFSNIFHLFFSKETSLIVTQRIASLYCVLFFLIYFEQFDVVIGIEKMLVYIFKMGQKKR